MRPPACLRLTSSPRTLLTSGFAGRREAQPEVAAQARPNPDRRVSQAHHRWVGTLERSRGSPLTDALQPAGAPWHPSDWSQHHQPQQQYYVRTLRALIRMKLILAPKVWPSGACASRPSSCKSPRELCRPQRCASHVLFSRIELTIEPQITYKKYLNSLYSAPGLSDWLSCPGRSPRVMVFGTPADSSSSAQPRSMDGS